MTARRKAECSGATPQAAAQASGRRDYARRWREFLSGGATEVSTAERVRTGEDGERSDLLNTQRPG